MAEQAEDAVSEIDRIARECWSDIDQLELAWTATSAPEYDPRNAIRAALIEYGDIVREECAKEADAEAESFLVEAQDHAERGWNRTEQELRRQAQGCRHVAATIRNK